jgi:hypothetical protein
MKILVDMNLSPSWVDFLIEASDAGCGLSGERGRLNIHAEAVALLRESGWVFAIDRSFHTLRLSGQPYSGRNTLAQLPIDARIARRAPKCLSRQGIKPYLGPARWPTPSTACRPGFEIA